MNNRFKKKNNNRYLILLIKRNDIFEGNVLKVVKTFNANKLVVPKKNKKKPIANSKKQDVNALNKIYFKPVSIDTLDKLEAIKIVKVKVNPSILK